MEIPNNLFKKRNIHIYISVKFAHASRKIISSRFVRKLNFNESILNRLINKQAMKNRRNLHAIIKK
jgi:hypothetical protein